MHKEIVPLVFIFKKRKQPQSQDYGCPWRREWDSNPRVIAHKLISSQPRYDHFDISASMLNPILEYNDDSIFHRTGRPVMSCCGARNFLLAIRFAKFRPLPLLFAPFIRYRRRSQTSPLRYLCIYVKLCWILTGNSLAQLIRPVKCFPEDFILWSKIIPDQF